MERILQEVSACDEVILYEKIKQLEQLNVEAGRIGNMVQSITERIQELLRLEPENFAEFARARDKRSRLRDDYSDKVAEIKTAELKINWAMEKMGAWEQNG